MFCHKSFSFRVDCNKGRSSNRRKLPHPVGATPLPPEATSLQCKFTTIIHFLPFRVYFYESNNKTSYRHFHRMFFGPYGCWHTHFFIAIETSGIANSRHRIETRRYSSAPQGLVVRISQASADVSPLSFRRFQDSP